MPEGTEFGAHTGPGIMSVLLARVEKIVTHGALGKGLSSWKQLALDGALLQNCLTNYKSKR